MRFQWMILVVAVAILFAGCGKKKQAEQSVEAETAIDTVYVEPPVEQPAPAKPVARRSDDEQSRKPTEPEAPKRIAVSELPKLVEAHKDRLERIYREQSQMIDMRGGVEFTLYLNANGDIEKVEVNPDSDAQFTESFLQAAMQDIGQWRLPVDEATSHTFRMVFMK